MTSIPQAASDALEEFDAILQKDQRNPDRTYDLAGWADDNDMLIRALLTAAAAQPAIEIPPCAHRNCAVDDTQPATDTTGEGLAMFKAVCFAFTKTDLPAGEIDGYLTTLRTLLSKPAAVPDGWKLVPIQMTTTMLGGFIMGCTGTKMLNADDIKAGYAGAIAAAPPPNDERGGE